MTRGRLLAILVAVAIVSAIWMLLPRRARELTLAPDPRVVRGAIHVHTTRSDGAGTPDDVARAARHAGLDFVILTDHGDGLRAPDPPRYVDGVLVIDAVEISTADGHLVALGIGQAPYRLAGDARDVIDDVHRLGGFGFAAHPDSPKAQLRWKDADVWGDGFEWINADSEWRDETRLTLARAVLTYGLRGPESIVAMFDRPDASLAGWDLRGATARIVAIGAADAHARVPLGPGAEPGEGQSLHIPSYESSFRALSVSVELPTPVQRTSASASADASRVLAGLRAGHTFTTIDGIAGPARLTFSASSLGGRASMGDAVLADGPVTLSASLAPAMSDAFLSILKNSHEIVAESASHPVTVEHGPLEGAAVYRVEVHLPGAPGTPPVPWIVSNPIYVRPVWSVPAAVVREEVRVLAESSGGRSWAIEKAPTSQASIAAGVSTDGTSGMRFTWRLGDGVPHGQYAALALPVSAADFEGIDALELRLQAPRPMRLSVQLRVPQGTDLRWERSVYVDATPRSVVLPLGDMRPVDGPKQQHVDLARVDTLLLVVDTVNATPGSAGECWVGKVAVARPTRRAEATSAQ